MLTTDTFEEYLEVIDNQLRNNGYDYYLTGDFKEIGKIFMVINSPFALLVDFKNENINYLIYDGEDYEKFDFNEMMNIYSFFHLARNKSKGWFNHEELTTFRRDRIKFLENVVGTQKVASSFGEKIGLL